MTRNGNNGEWLYTRRRSTGWIRGIGGIIDKLKERGILDSTLILFLSDNGGNYEELTRPGDGLGDMRRSMFIPHETLDGRLVRFGNDPRHAARWRRHVPELRNPVGQREQHAFSALQALRPRRGDFDTPDRPLAGRLFRQAGTLTLADRTRNRHHGHLSGRGRGAATPPTYQGRTASYPLEGKKPGPDFSGRATGRATPRSFGSTRATARSVKGNGNWWPSIRIIGSFTTWKRTARSCTTWPTSIRSGSRIWRHDTGNGRNELAYCLGLLPGMVDSPSGTPQYLRRDG